MTAAGPILAGGNMSGPREGDPVQWNFSQFNLTLCVPQGRQVSFQTRFLQVFGPFKCVLCQNTGKKWEELKKVETTCWTITVAIDRLGNPLVNRLTSCSKSCHPLLGGSHLHSFGYSLLHSFYLAPRVSGLELGKLRVSCNAKQGGPPPLCSPEGREGWRMLST